MLTELKVRDFAIIDSLHVQFSNGLNILSGETGAGKSVLLKSLGLLMGEKSSNDLVRSGADQAAVEGVFDLTGRNDTLDILATLGIDVEDQQLVVRRLISSEGKSKVYLNGSLCALATLKEIVSPLIEVAGPHAPLIEMTGQHESRHLLSSQYHMDVVDRFGALLPLRKQVSDLYTHAADLGKRITELEDAKKTRTQRLDFLTYQFEELKGLNLQPGEEAELEQKADKLKYSSKLLEFIETAENVLYGDEDSALVRIHRVTQMGQALLTVDPALGSRVDSLLQAKSILEDTMYDLRNYAKDLNLNPEERDEVESRLSQVKKLQKKHGVDSEGLIKMISDFETEIDLLQNSDERMEEMKKELKVLEKNLRTTAEELHRRRQKIAKGLSEHVNEELSDLNMKGVHFLIAVNPADHILPTGLSDVEFQIQNSKKDEPRAISKFASGGELSRILLSLKRVLGPSDRPRTYLFDEVDTGVSGQTAERVGRKLREISKGQQVICVTHLPQVAAFASHHYLIEKGTSKKGVAMDIRELKKDDRVKEIARLISGEKISSSSLEHARSLLKEVSL